MHRILLLPFVLFLLNGCSPNASSNASNDSAPDAQAEVLSTTATPLEIQGHRGARGLLPENTTPGFVLALREGADVLEMDLCISADSIIIVSHEPWMSATICQSRNGEAIAEESEASLNLYTLSYDQIRKFDCGSKKHPDFPEQQPLPIHKPALSEVVKVTETVPLLEGGMVRYNLEIKHRPEWENIHCPDADAFARLVLDEVQRLNISDRTCIQSFSPAALEAVHRMDPSMTTAWLTSAEGVEKELARLSFQPTIYSPLWTSINAEDVRSLQSQGIRVIPWTVNAPEDLHAVMQMGVDGIITDYPDRLYDMR